MGSKVSEMINFLIMNQQLEKNMASHSKLRTMTPITSETAFSDNMSSSDVEQSVELLQRNIEAYEAAIATMKS